MIFCYISSSYGLVKDKNTLLHLFVLLKNDSSKFMMNVVRLLLTFVEKIVHVFLKLVSVLYLAYNVSRFDFIEALRYE